MMHRIRQTLNDVEMPMLKNVVEIDEVYVGGRNKNMSNKKRKALREANPGNYNYSAKTMVVGMVERGGNLKLHVAGSSNSKAPLIPAVLTS